MQNNVRPAVAGQLALSVKEACEASSLGRTTFYKLLKSGMISARKCGGRTIVLVSELEQMLKSLPQQEARRE